MGVFAEKIKELEEVEQKLQIEKAQLVQKSLKSEDINDIYASKKYLSQIEQKQDQPVKSIIIDPYHLNSSFGYREKNNTLNYYTLRGMSKVHIVNSILKTRRTQILSFCEPQRDKYSTGFIIKKKTQDRFGVKDSTITKEEQKKINEITDFILNCGSQNSVWTGDDFNSFTSKFIQDSLSLDQGTFEVVTNRKGIPTEFFATDGATFRIADERPREEELIKGHSISHVQVLDGRVVSEYYPWELCFGVRNPTTDIYKQGYGESELEILIKTVTSILNSDHYNSNFFRVGSNPRGLLRYSGNINQNSLSEFRENWNTMMTGVNNMHKVPIVNADKIDWITTHETNKDMEFTKYYEFLIKVSCAVYTIDPSEIGFPMSGSADSKPMFEGNNEARLKYSKDKGLKPLLKFYQKLINKWIVSRLDPRFEFEFVGVDSTDEDTELDRDIKEVTNLKTIDEIRKKRGDEPLPDGKGNIILNSFYMQQQQAAMYGGQDSNSQVDQDDPFQEISSDEESGAIDMDKSEDPFVQSLNNYFKKI